MPRPEDHTRHAFLRLLAEGRRGGQAKVDALLALAQRTVIVPIWGQGNNSYRTLVNSAGETALPVFTDRESLAAAAEKFEWSDDGRAIPYEEIGARQALRHVMGADIEFVVVDVTSSHSLEARQAEVQPLLVTPRRSDASGPYAGAGRISSQMLSAVGSGSDAPGRGTAGRKSFEEVRPSSRPSLDPSGLYGAARKPRAKRVSRASFPAPSKTGESSPVIETDLRGEDRPTRELGPSTPAPQTEIRATATGAMEFTSSPPPKTNRKSQRAFRPPSEDSITPLRDLTSSAPRAQGASGQRQALTPDGSVSEGDGAARAQAERSSVQIGSSLPAAPPRQSAMPAGASETGQSQSSPAAARESDLGLSSGLPGLVDGTQPPPQPGTAGDSAPPLDLRPPSVPPRGASKPPESLPVITPDQLVDYHAPAAPRLPNVAVPATAPPRAGNDEAEGPATPAAPSAPAGVIARVGSVSPGAANFGGGENITFGALTEPAPEPLLEAISEALRVYPEVEWAVFCMGARGPAAPRPTVALRVLDTFRQNVASIVGDVLAVGRANGAALDTVLLDQRLAIRSCRDVGEVFYPWRRKSRA